MPILIIPLFSTVLESLTVCLGAVKNDLLGKIIDKRGGDTAKIADYSHSLF
jgi:hypothetical protein